MCSMPLKELLPTDIKVWEGQKSENFGSFLVDYEKQVTKLPIKSVLALLCDSLSPFINLERWKVWASSSMALKWGNKMLGSV